MGIAYRQHDHLTQDAPGNIIEANKDSYAPGGTLAAQVDLGDAIYKSLAAKQLVKAAGHALEAQRQESALCIRPGLSRTGTGRGSGRRRARGRPDCRRL